MKRKTLFVLVAFLSLMAFLTSTALADSKKEKEEKAKKEKSENDRAGKKLIVLNPCGQPPERPVKPMAPRLDTLEGKRIYVSSINFPYTNDFVEELAIALQETYPEAEWVFRLKYGSYGTDDPDLWQEIKENGDAMVMAVGH